MSEFARHVLKSHSHNRSVIAILNKPKRSRRKDFDVLRKSAIQRHKKVLRTGCGEIIVSRRSATGTDANEFLPCPKCQVLMKPKNIWRHFQAFEKLRSPSSSSSKEKSSVV